MANALRKRSGETEEKIIVGNKRLDMALSAHAAVHARSKPTDLARETVGTQALNRSCPAGFEETRLATLLRSAVADPHRVRRLQKGRVKMRAATNSCSQPLSLRLTSQTCAFLLDGGVRVRGVGV